MKNYKNEQTMLRIIWIGIQNWIYEDFEGELLHGEEVTKEEYKILVNAYNKQQKIG